MEKGGLMANTGDIVAKLWALCHVLRDDGVTYNEYVTELTFLLFLKMLEETGKESRLPKTYRWGELAKREGLDQLDYYKRLLLDLGKPDTKDSLVRAIFTDAQTRLRKPTNLKALTASIDQLDWFSAREEGLGKLYEGLLEKNASDKKSGAGQYFTPRRLIDCIVRLMKPQAGETVQDPAAGTAGFLVAADRYIKDHTDDLYKLPEQKAFFQRHNAFVGAELVPDTHRLCMMNLLLHGIEGGVELADTLSPDGERLPKTDLVLTNPPFGTKKGGGRPTRSDFSVTADTSNKQLAFVEHIVRALKPGGRAAMVVPDNVLFEDGWGGGCARGLWSCATFTPSYGFRPASSMPRASRPTCCSSSAARPTRLIPKGCGSMTCGRTCRPLVRPARLQSMILWTSKKPMAAIPTAEQSARIRARTADGAASHATRSAAEATISTSHGCATPKRKPRSN
jgi:type I restriction enzyme M protein